MKKIIVITILLLSTNWLYSQDNGWWNWWNKPVTNSTAPSGFQFQFVIPHDDYQIKDHGDFGFIGGNFPADPDTITIDWGDGNDTTVYLTGSGWQYLAHSYATAGTYNCELTTESDFVNGITQINFYGLDFGETDFSRINTFMPELTRLSLSRLQKGTGNGFYLVLDSIPATVTYLYIEQLDDPSYYYRNVTGSINNLRCSSATTVNLYTCINITGDLATALTKVPLVTDFKLDRDTLITGDISDLSGSSITSLTLYAMPKLTGSLNDLPAGLTYTYLFEMRNVTGNLDNLPANLGDMHLYKLGAISGNLASLATINAWHIMIYSDDGVYTITGDLGQLGDGQGSGYDYIYLNRIGTITYAIPYANWSSVAFIVLNNLGFTQTEIDNVLCDVDVAGRSNGYMDLRFGNASPSATGLVCKASLQGKGWTVLTE